MAFFKRDWNKPGPGVPKNAPKKTGIARIWEIFSRDLGSLFKLNLIQLVVLLPAVTLYLLFLLSFFSGQGFWALVFGLLALLACLPLGPSLTAVFYLLAQMLRDEPGFLWHDYKRKFKQNFRLTALPGLLFGALVGSIGFSVLYGSLAGVPVNWVVVALYFLAILFLALSYPYFFTQAAFIDLSATRLLQNSFLMAFANLPRSLAGMLFGSGLILAQLLLFPYSSIFTVFLGLSVPFLLNLFFIWPYINKTFEIDKALKEKHDEQYSEIESNKFE